MFPWADASSASLAKSSMKFSLSVFTVFLTALFASVYSSCAVAFAAQVWLLLITPFLPQLHFVDSVCRNPVFLLVFLLSKNFAACAMMVHISLICCHCVSMSMYPSLYTSSQ